MLLQLFQQLDTPGVNAYVKGGNGLVARNELGLHSQHPHLATTPR